MATQPQTPDSPPQAEDPPRDPPPTPDGPGPRDVPDDEVIDKTLPARSGERSG